MSTIVTDNDMQDNSALETTKDLYLIFETEKEYYAVNVINVIEIIPMCNITFVPEVPNYVKGIINLRGDIIPVIDVRTKFMKPEVDHTAQTCIIEITYQGYDLGLIVDQIVCTLTIPEEHISPPPSTKLRYSNQFVKSVGMIDDQVYLLLDLDKLIF
jgi:purine-binding chemotaxis protein CheW